ncbi:hypothetical protein EST38_g3465 [Candolleomyces aberdarensis]|uniref:Uncharacterized protein n=1 Tax=Candolleomyces aberdarensis TaxID=2316362 RepID=A0A4Q2DQS0_9AGAR|nr:hypothetical protein EST38_g3465 [Candolleomyces aberdarensis]
MSDTGDSLSGSDAGSGRSTPSVEGSQPETAHENGGAPNVLPDPNGSTDPNASQSETQKTIATLKEGYPATALIKVLLQHYGIDFPKYQRNIKTSHKLFDLWKSVYEAILTHMDKVEGATELLPESWDSFDKYTEAIGPFEALLLGLESPLADNEKPAVPTKDGVQALITFMGNWVFNRQKFITASTALEDGTYTALFDQAQSLDAAANVKRALNEDDTKVLQELNDGIKKHGLKDSDISGSGSEKLVTDVKNKVQAIQTAASSIAPDEHERMGKVVHAVMAIYIPFLARDNDLENAHIISKKVWDAAKAFAEETEQFAQKAPSMTIETFNEKWETYKKILLGEVGVFAMQIISLMRHAAQVRRPFFGRTVGIVRMWQALTESDKFAKEERASARKTLHALLTETEAEFKQTQKDVISFDQGLKATVDARQASYTTLVDKLKTEVKNYNPDKLTKVSQQYDKGAEVDDEHLKKFHAFIKANEQAAVLKAQIRV